MRFNIESNANRLAAAWERRARELAPVMRQATKEATDQLYTESRKQMTKLIYDRPVPTNEQIAAEKGLYVEVTGKGLDSRMSASIKRKIRRLEKKGFQLGWAYQGKQQVPAMFRTMPNGKVVLIPCGKWAKRKAWPRTGNLRRSEKRKLVGDYTGIIYNDADYAAARHAMGTPGAKRKTRYKAPWRAVAIYKTRFKIKQIYRDALRRAIRIGLVGGI